MNEAKASEAEQAEKAKKKAEKEAKKAAKKAAKEAEKAKKAEEKQAKAAAKKAKQALERQLTWTVVPGDGTGPSAAGVEIPKGRRPAGVVWNGSGYVFFWCPGGKKK